MKTISPEKSWVHPDAEDLFDLFLQCSKDKMSAAEALSEEEEDGDAIMRGDDVDEDKEVSDASSFVMHDFFLATSDRFLSVFCVRAVVIHQLSIALRFLESCKHASCILVMSSISTNFMNNVLCSCCWEHQN